MRNVEIVAHRGASIRAPENTLVAYERAWEDLADAGECDVRVSGDGVPILCHDKDLERVADMPDCIVAETPWADLQAVQIKGPDGERAPMATLEQLLDAMPAGKRLFVELKTGIGDPARIIDMLRAFPRPREIVVISFNRELTTAFRDARGGWAIHLLGDRDAARRTLERAAEDGLQGINVQHTAIDPAFLEQASDFGLDVHAWTTNDPARGRELARLGVKGITTDDPRAMRG